MTVTTSYHQNLSEETKTRMALARFENLRKKYKNREELTKVTFQAFADMVFSDMEFVTQLCLQLMYQYEGSLERIIESHELGAEDRTECWYKKIDDPNTRQLLEDACDLCKFSIK
jgi:hypothetical protein